MELFTLYGALASVFDIKKPEGTDHVPWYEVHPYVITMCRPFPMDIKPRSEAKRQFILDGCPDPGYTLKEKKETRWDQTFIENGKPWSWQDLITPYEQPKVPRVYPDGV